MPLDIHYKEEIMGWARALAVANDEATMAAMRALKMAGVPSSDPAYALVEAEARGFKLGLAVICLTAGVEPHKLPAPLERYARDMLPGQVLIKNWSGES